MLASTVGAFLAETFAVLMMIPLRWLDATLVTSVTDFVPFAAI